MKYRSTWLASLSAVLVAGLVASLLAFGTGASGDSPTPTRPPQPGQSSPTSPGGTPQPWIWPDN